MSFKWFDLVVMFGLLQGLVCALLLAKQKPLQLNHKLLIAILLVFGLLSFKIELHTLGLWDIADFRYFPLGIDLLIQPLLYFYVASLSQQGFALKGLKWLHFVAPFLFFVHAVWIYLLVATTSSLALKDAIANQWHYNTIKTVEDVLSVISACVYGYLCLNQVNRYQQWLQQNVSDTSYSTLNWLKTFLYLTGCLGLLLFVNILLDYTSSSPINFLRWQFFYIYLALLLYFLGIKGLTMKPLPQLAPATSSLSTKYSADQLHEATTLIVKVLKEEQPFLDPELSLQKFAAALQLSPALVSAAINTDLQKSFRSLINDYRVEAVKLNLIDPQYAHLSLLGIGLEAGFNSEASFYRIFKSTTGYSPKTYISKFTNPTTTVN